MVDAFDDDHFFRLREHGEQTVVSDSKFVLGGTDEASEIVHGVLARELEAPNDPSGDLRVQSLQVTDGGFRPSN